MATPQSIDPPEGFVLDDTPPLPAGFSLDSDSPSPKLVPSKELLSNVEMEKARLNSGYDANSNDLLRAIANSRYSGIDKESPSSVALAPLTIAGNIARAAVSDAMATATGHPSYGGNLNALSNEEPLPADVINAEISKRNPIAATAGKIAQGTLSQTPAIALFPEGALGKLAAAGFTAEMLNNAGKSARVLGEELGKNPEDRDADKITSALSDIAQSTAFAPLAGKHAASKAISKATTIAGLASALSKEPYKPVTLSDISREPENAIIQPADTVAPKTTSKAYEKPIIQEQDWGNIKRPHFVGVQDGLNLSEKDVPQLEMEMKSAYENAGKAFESGDDSGYKANFGKGTYIAGVIEGAKKQGPNYDIYIKENAARGNGPSSGVSLITPAASESKPSEPVNSGVVENQAAIPPVQKEPSQPSQKFRIGNNPTLHTLVEKLPASKAEIENGEQPVSVKNEKTGEVQTVLESDLTPVNERVGEKPKKANISDKLKKLGYSDTEIGAMSKVDAKALADRGQPKTPRVEGLKGLGGHLMGEEPYSPIQHMADTLRATASENDPIDAKLKTIDRVKARASDAKESIKNSFSKLLAVKDAIWQKYTGRPEYGDEQRAVGKWFYALQRADAEARNFAKEVVKAVPNKIRREAITNWIQADGDVGILTERAKASKGSIRAGYEAASKLTPREVEIAKMLRDYYDIQLERGIDAGILKEGVENYITQVWKKENPITKKLLSDLAYNKLTPNFKYARKRIFDSYFEGEQAGYKPNKDAGFLVANYDQSFNRTLAARAFIKDLHEGVASDGRPLVELSGKGNIVEQTGARSLDQPKAILINPHAKPEEISDYRTIDHPALRGWKWISSIPEAGKNVILKGDMLVHPEAYQKLKNRLSVSAFRQNPVSRAILNAQTSIKQTMLSVSGFHQVQETLHALGHRVNPTNLPEIDFADATTKDLVTHGLQLADYNALDSFSEGLSGGNLTNKIPIIGKNLHAYNEWLFQDYIPRLKLAMAKHALERNRERYPNLPNDKLLELTSSQANSAFGELPYRYWGRSPTMQDALRTFILAPDFLEARTRFVGQAAKPYGREQLVALGLLAMTQYVTARIVNQVLDNDPHWEYKNAFRIVSGKHAYGLRTIPSDIAHLLGDTRGFFYNRMSPMLRTAFEAISGRDDRGLKRDMSEQLKDLAKMAIPISLKSRLGTSMWEQFLNAFGVQNQRWDAVQTLNERVQKFKKDNGITTPYETSYNQDEDKYAKLRLAIQDDKKSEAQDEFRKLSKEIPTYKIQEHFRLSYSHPLTGSKANDEKFYKSLDENGKQEFREAQDLRDARLKMVMSLK